MKLRLFFINNYAKKLLEYNSLLISAFRYPIIKCMFQNGNYIYYWHKNNIFIENKLLDPKFRSTEII